MDDEDAVVAVLSEVGEPDRVAAEYEPNRRHLIGDFRAGVLLVNALWFSLRAMLIASVLVVFIFVWLQRAEMRLLRTPRLEKRSWDPRSLRARRTVEPASRFDSAVGLVAAAAMLVILGGVGQVARDVLGQVSTGFST